MSLFLGALVSGLNVLRESFTLIAFRALLYSVLRKALRNSERTSRKVECVSKQHLVETPETSGIFGGTVWSFADPRAVPRLSENSQEWCSHSCGQRNAELDKQPWINSLVRTPQWGECGSAQER